MEFTKGKKEKRGVRIVIVQKRIQSFNLHLNQ